MVIAAAGLALARLVWQPPVLGYLVAGMIIGPYTLPTPLISDLDTIGLLAELGLILLLFGIGLELGWRRIQQIGFRVLVIGVTEISLLTLLGVWIASILPGIDPSHGLYLGGAMAISSSAILLKGLRDGGNLNSGWGQTIVGILLVEDFAAVILLTVLAGLATTGTASLADAGILAGKLAIFCVVVLVAGTMLGARVMRWLSRLQSDETLLLASLGFCFLLALCATLLGLSPAAGSFLVGIVIGDTEAAGRVNRMVSPVRDMFGALFFLSIGMLIDYRTLDDYILPALVVVAVFMIGKMAANTVGSILAGRNIGDAMRVGYDHAADGRVLPGDWPAHADRCNGSINVGTGAVHRHRHHLRTGPSHRKGGRAPDGMDGSKVPGPGAPRDAGHQPGRGHILVDAVHPRPGGTADSRRGPTNPD